MEGWQNGSRDQLMGYCNDSRGLDLNDDSGVVRTGDFFGSILMVEPMSYQIYLLCVSYIRIKFYWSSLGLFCSLHLQSLEQ